jgi:hypothetical protein
VDGRSGGSRESSKDGLSEAADRGEGGGSGWRNGSESGREREWREIAEGATSKTRSLGPGRESCAANRTVAWPRILSARLR